MALDATDTRAGTGLVPTQQIVREARLRRDIIHGSIIFTLLFVIVFSGLFFIFDHSFFSAAFYAYIAIGVVYIVLDVVTIRNSQRKWEEDPRYSFRQLLAKLSGQGNTTQKIRINLWLLFRVISQYSIWPFVIIAILLKKTALDLDDPLSLMAKSELERNDVILSTTLAFLSMVVLVVFDAQVPRDLHLKLFIWVIMLHVMARHMAYVLNPSPLQVNLRRTIGNPYFQFLAIAICDLLVLCAAFGLIGNYLAGSQITFQGLLQVGKKMLSLKDSWDMLTSGTEPPIRYLMGFAGILYYTNIVKVLIHYKKFERQDQDLLTIAARYMLTGRFREALHWLEKTMNQDSTVRGTLAVANLGVGKIDKAIRYTKKTIMADQAVDIDDQALYLLFNSIINFRVPQVAYLRLLEHGAALGVSDSILSFGIRFYTALYDDSQPEEILEIVQKDDRRETYPLTYSTCVLIKILMAVDELAAHPSADDSDDEIYDRLETEFDSLVEMLMDLKLDKVRDNIVKSVIILNCYSLTFGDEMPSEESLAEIQQHFSDLTNDVQRLTHDWEKIFAIQNIEGMLVNYDDNPMIKRLILDLMHRIGETLEDTKAEAMIRRGSQLLYQQNEPV